MCESGILTFYQEQSHAPTHRSNRVQMRQQNVLVSRHAAALVGQPSMTRKERGDGGTPVISHWHKPERHAYNFEVGWCHHHHHHQFQARHKRRSLQPCALSNSPCPCEKCMSCCGMLCMWPVHSQPQDSNSRMCAARHWLQAAATCQPLCAPMIIGERGS